MHNPFKDCDTEYTFLKTLKEKKLYSEYNKVVLQITISENVVNGIPKLIPRPQTVYILPLVHQVKAFFELPNVLELTLKNIDELYNQNNIKNFVNGKIFKRTNNVSSYTY